MAEEDEFSTEGTPTSSADTLYFLDLVRQMSANPTAGKDWELADIIKFLGWLLWESALDRGTPERNRQDIFAIHCLLSTKVFHIDQLLRPLEDGVLETCLSLAVKKNDVTLITYLLKMGASPDVLVGPVSSFFSKPALFASDRPCPTYAALLLEHGKAHSRLPDQVSFKVTEVDSESVQLRLLSTSFFTDRRNALGNGAQHE